MAGGRSSGGGAGWRRAPRRMGAIRPRAGLRPVPPEPPAPEMPLASWFLPAEGKTTRRLVRAWAPAP